MKRTLILFACVCLVFGTVSYVSAAGETVIVVSFAGDIRIISPGGGAVSCQPGMLLKEGARIVTGKESYVDLAMDRSERNIMKVTENSEVVVKLDGSETIGLIDGEVFTLLQGMKKGKTFRIRTPSAVCGARGTGWGTKTDGETTDVAVFENRVFVRGINRDGSVMEEEDWIENGFERRIERYKRAGKMQKVSEARLSAMREAFDPGKKKTEIRKKKMLVVSTEAAKREDRMERVQDRKDMDKLEQMQKKVDTGGSGDDVQGS